MEAQGAKRDSKHGGPARGIARDDHVPDAVPVLVEIVDPDELGVPHRAVRIGAKDKGPTAVVKAVDQQLDVVITGQVRVTPQFAGPHLPHVAVVGADRDVQRLRVPKHLDHATLARGRAYRWLPLPEIDDGVRAGPVRAVQPTVQGNRDGRGDDVQAPSSASLSALLCRQSDGQQQCQREKGPHQGASVVAVRWSDKVCESALFPTPNLPRAVDPASGASSKFFSLKYTTSSMPRQSPRRASQTPHAT